MRFGLKIPIIFYLKKNKIENTHWPLDDFIPSAMCRGWSPDWCIQRVNWVSGLWNLWKEGLFPFFFQFIFVKFVTFSSLRGYSNSLEKFTIGSFLIRHYLYASESEISLIEEFLPPKSKSIKKMLMRGRMKYEFISLPFSRLAWCSLICFFFFFFFSSSGSWDWKVKQFWISRKNWNLKHSFQKNMG